MKQDQRIAGFCAVATLFLCAAAFRAEGEKETATVAGGGPLSAVAHEAALEEVPLLGVAHVGIQVGDLDKSRHFYHDVLGFEEVFDLPASNSREAAVAFFKINDRQFIELFSGLRPDKPAPIRYVGLYTNDLSKLHALLQKRGLAPGPIGKSREGNLKCSLPSPRGLELASLDFVQYMPESLHTATRGKGMSSRRLGTCVNHIGLVAGDLGVGRKFCVEMLGCREANTKKRENGTVYAVHLNLPGSSGEFFELSARPSQFDRHQGGIKTHLCLGCADAEAAYRQAVNGAKLEPVQSTRGKQEKFPFLLFDPDHSRIEFKPEPKAAK